MFTTRPDTLYGAAVFGTVAAPSADPGAGGRTTRQWPSSSPNAATEMGTSEEAIETAEKRGYATGIDAVHPLDKDRQAECPSILPISC